MTAPNWYMVNKLGMATLCSDKDGAEKEAADAQMAWPHMGPHRAVQLVEAADVEALRAALAKLGARPVEREPLTDKEIREWWASENALEDCDMCKLADFGTVVRAVEEMHRIKGGLHP